MRVQKSENERLSHHVGESLIVIEIRIVSGLEEGLHLSESFNGVVFFAIYARSRGQSNEIIYRRSDGTCIRGHMFHELGI